ncbi:MAG: hypothetical protein KDD14_25740 [Saprospiraceae bacterium]|nr:hypothetical protein [Saprospiraceae bacterium]
MSVVQSTITSESKALQGTASPLLEMEIHREVNRIPYAMLVLRDGDAAKQEFSYSNEADLAPGKTLDIDLAYVGGDAGQKRPPAFKGIIVRHAVEVDATGSRLNLEVRSLAYKMTQQRKSRVFREMTDSDIFKRIIEEYGLQASNIAATQPKHMEMVQYNCTDWDFLLSRADANGLWVMVNFDQQGNERIDVVKPQLEGASLHTFAFGKRTPLIYNLEMQTDLEQVQGKVQSTAWDRDKQKMIDPVQAGDFVLTQGNIKPVEIAAVLGSSSVLMKSPATMDRSELQFWADAQLTKSRLATIRGRVQVKGEAVYQLNDLIAIDGISGPFNGNTLITGIRHHSIRQSWKTDIQFGMAPG